MRSWVTRTSLCISFALRERVRQTVWGGVGGVGGVYYIFANCTNLKGSPSYLAEQMGWLSAPLRGFSTSTSLSALSHSPPSSPPNLPFSSQFLGLLNPGSDRAQGLGRSTWWPLPFPRRRRKPAPPQSLERPATQPGPRRTWPPSAHASSGSARNLGHTGHRSFRKAGGRIRLCFLNSRSLRPFLLPPPPTGHGTPVFSRQPRKGGAEIPGSPR